uniref:C-type lectin domain-containing protein n=1 Tax=Ictidomys tridecemlineatus TaxID=43179 RepID=A0A287D1N4_ICTTR
MEFHSDLENLDEDGYTQLDFTSRGITRRPVKGDQKASPPWRLIAVTISVICLITLVIAVVLGVLGLFSSPCPPEWIIHEKSCYLFSMSLNSWQSSKIRCSQLGSHLLKIDSSSELFQIRSTDTQENILHNCGWIHMSTVYDQYCYVTSFSICEKKLS